MEFTLGEPAVDRVVVGRLGLTFALPASVAPELHTIPPLRSPEQVDPMLKTRAEGAFVPFPDRAAMRELARRRR